MIVSHVLAGLPVSPSMYRGSILDITNPSRYGRFEIFSNVSEVYSDTGNLNTSYPDYGFSSVGSDEAPAMRTWSAVSGAEFDLTFELSSPALLNGGLGSFKAGNTTAHEWGVPAGKTKGWFRVDGSKIAVDVERSLTWYDRQWNGAPTSWTWFELHIESEKHGASATPYSIWVWGEDTPGGSAGLATIRDAAGVQRVVPVVSMVTSSRTFTSPVTGIVYNLDWTLKLADGTEFCASSVREDQELYGEGGVFPTYEGFATVSGVYNDGQKVKGYGLN